MLHFDLNFLSLSGLFVFISCGITAALVLYGERAKERISWGLFSILVAAWGLGVFFAFATDDYEFSLFFTRFINLVAIFIPILFFHFVSLFLERYEKEKRLIVFIYLLGGVLLTSALIFPNAFVVDIRGVFEFKYYPLAGPLFYVFTAFFLLLSVNRMYLLLKALRKRPKNKRISYVFWSTFLSYSGGVTTFPLLFDIEFYPIGIMGPSLLVVSVAYVLSTLNRIDVKTLISRLLALVITVVLILFSVIAVHHYSENILYLDFALYFFLMLFWGIFGAKVYAQIFYPIKKKFIAETYDVDEIVSRLSRELLRVESKWDIFEVLGKEFRESFEATRVYFMILTQANLNEPYELINSQDSKDELNKSYPKESAVLKFSAQQQRIFSFNRLPKLAQAELKTYKFSKKSIIIPIHSLGDFHGFILLDQKLSEKEYNHYDISFLQVILNQVIVAFDRTIQRELLQEANRVEKNLNDELSVLNDKLKEKELELEEKVKEETKIKEKALSVAEELAHKASFATLTLGIAHEIRNPISAIQGNATYLAERLAGKHDLAFEIEPDAFMWATRVSKEQFVREVTEDEKAVYELWDYLVAQELISNDGCFDDKNFRPFSPFFEIDLPVHLKAHERRLCTVLLNTYLRDKVLRTLGVFEKETKRVERICNNMMEYGTTGQGITNKAFSELVGAADSDKVWTELQDNGFLDEKGMVTDAFTPNHSFFELGLSEKFKPFELLIIEIVNKNKRAHRANIQVNLAVQAALDLFDGKFRKNGVQVTQLIDHSLPLINGNHDDLVQSVGNIFTNAIDVLEKMKGKTREIVVATKLTRKQYNKRNGNFVEISIQDSGPGIPQDMIPRIMDPFYTSKGVTGGKNIGLGLSIVSKIVSRLEGHIEVESEEGEGTTFRLYFPISKIG